MNKSAILLGESLGLFRNTGFGRLVNQTSVQFGFGGAESNVAIGLRKFGHEVTWVSRLGSDPAGELISRTLAGLGIKTWLEIDSDSPTGLMLRETIRPDLTKVYYYRAGSAASKMSPSLIDGLDWKSTDMFHSTGITLGISNGAFETATQAFFEAAKHSVSNSLDINLRRKIVGEKVLGDRVQKVLPYLDYLFGSEEELLIVAPEADSGADAARKISRENDCTVVLKLGPNGAQAYVSGKEEEYIGNPTSPVDSVGAGDAFVAGFLSAIHSGSSLRDSLALGHQMGRITATSSGDWESQPELDELETGQDVVR